MSTSPRGGATPEAAKPQAASPQAETPRRPTNGRSHGTWRGRERLRLVGARRGDGAVVWSGRAIPVAYELDVFASGAHCTIQGALEGDLSRLKPRGPAGPIQTGVRLRLDDGQEIDIELAEVGTQSAEFNAALALAEAEAVVQRQAP